jgi:hypothetical protein
MGRPALLKVELSDDERSQLVRIARGEKRPFQEVQRARIVLYSSEGMSDIDIAARLDTTPRLVGKWRRRFVQERLQGLADRPRSGRPRRFPPGADRRGQGYRLRAADPLRAAALQVLSR